VEATCNALEAGDFDTVGQALREGMCSLREDFEVSTPELDRLCASGDAAPGVYGSRLTGAGFGGCSIHLVEPEAAGDAADFIASGFEREFGRRPKIQRVSPADGACATTLRG
jgi:galactokinase